MPANKNPQNETTDFLATLVYHIYFLHNQCFLWHFIRKLFISCRFFSQKQSDAGNGKINQVFLQPLDVSVPQLLHDFGSIFLALPCAETILQKIDLMGGGQERHNSIEF